MALAYLTKSAIRALAFNAYDEAQGSSDEFTTTFVDTAVNEAVKEFVLLTGCVTGTVSRARPTSTTGEATVTLPTGMRSIFQVDLSRTVGGTNTKRTLTETSGDKLRAFWGPYWMHMTSSIMDGNATTPGQWSHMWYQRDPTTLGFFPQKYNGTVGTVTLFGVKVPDIVTASQSITIPPEYVPGIVKLTAAIMASRDVNADGTGQRAVRLKAEAQPYIDKAASLGRP